MDYFRKKGYSFIRFYTTISRKLIFLRFWLNIFSKAYFYGSSLAFFGENLHSIARSVVQCDSFRNRRKTKSGTFPGPDRLLYFMKALFPSFDPALAFATSVLDSVIKCIFSQRLDGKLRNRDPAEFFWYIDLKFQNVPVAVLLDLQITQCMTFFLRERDDIFSLGK